MDTQPNRSGHEFTDDQTRLLAELARRMKWFAFLMIGSSLISLATTAWQVFPGGATSGVAAGSMVMSVITTVLFVMVALMTLSAANSMRSVATHKGDDGIYLVAALHSLKRVFGIQYWAILTLVLLTMAWVFGVFAWIAFSA